MSQLKVPIIAHSFSASTYSPMECLNIDFVGPFPNKGYILSIVDTFSRWIELHCTHVDSYATLGNPLMLHTVQRLSGYLNTFFLYCHQLMLKKENKHYHQGVCSASLDATVSVVLVACLDLQRACPLYSHPPLLLQHLYIRF
jgi:hypothetical protein